MTLRSWPLDASSLRQVQVGAATTTLGESMSLDHHETSVCLRFQLDLGAFSLLELQFTNEPVSRV